MATLATGKTWLTGDTVTPALLNQMVNSATISNIQTAEIADGAVTNAKIASGVDAGKLTTGTLSADRIASATITNDKISSGVDASKLTTGTLPADRIGSSAITEARINNGAVTASKLSTSGTAGTGVGYVRATDTNYVIVQGPTGSRFAHAWGFSNSTSTTDLTTVNFPVTFSSAPSVTATVNGILFGFGRMVSTGTVSTTNFTYQVRNDSGGAEGNPIHWIAIGPVA